MFLIKENYFLKVLYESYRRYKLSDTFSVFKEFGSTMQFTRKGSDRWVCIFKN